jgi:uncharacterized protein YciI
MGLFVIECTDKPDGFALRQEVRPKHLEFAADLGDNLLLGGPFLDDEERMIGSLLIIRAESLVEAEAIAARDPYVKAGLFTATSVRPWRWTVKKPEGV